MERLVGSQHPAGYVFEVPAAAARAVLRVIRGDETSDIPLEFTVARR